MDASCIIDPTDSRALLALYRDLALAAGREIMDVYRSKIIVETKSDESPVTEADRRSEAVILAGLRKACPEVLCVAEEEMSHGLVVSGPCDTFMLIDPLDGTREFVNAKTDFTVNIALIREGAPILGVVYAPARNVLYAGGPDGSFVYDVDAAFACGQGRRISVRRASSVPRIVASRSHRTAETDAFIERYPGAEIASVGSSLKFCLLAAGEADLYPRFGRTMEWDTAAGDAVLRAAGGFTRTVDGRPLTYGKRPGADVDFSNPWFVASGGIEAPVNIR